MIVACNYNINGIYYNGYRIVKVMGCDDKVVYEEKPPTPPSNWKFAYTYEGITYYILCNDSPVITRLEVEQSAYNNGVKTSAITDVEVGTCVTTIGDNLCNEFLSLTSATIPNNVVTIEESAFRRCPLLPSLAVPSGVTVIPDAMADADFVLSSTTIPNNTTSIGIEAYMDCLSLLDITIPSSVTYIGDSAFRSSYWSEEGSKYQYDLMVYMNAHRTVTCLATTPPTLAESDAFSIITGGRDIAAYPIFVPAQSVNAYKTATNWSVYADRIFPIT